MRAICCTAYGGPEVLELKEVARPSPRKGQFLVRVRAATVTLGDCEVRGFRLPGWIWLPARLAIGIIRPRQPVLGMEIAGEVVQLGEGTTRFAIGDRVFGSTAFGMGAYADYTVVSSTAAVTTIPPTVSFAEAAGIPTGGLNGLHFVRKSDPKPGERVLINGAGGSIGTFALQLAKQAGAVVTGVDRSDKHAMLAELGADHVIDFQATNFWEQGERYDVVIDVVGTSPFRETVAIIADGGRYFLGNPRLGQVLGGMLENMRGRIKVMAQLAGEALEDLDFLKHRVAERSLKVVIDRLVPLEEVPQAHAYVESGAKKGVLVIEVSREEPSSQP